VIKSKVTGAAKSAANTTIKSDNGITCTLCNGLNLQSPQEVRQHVIKFHADTLVQCDLCGVQCVSKRALQTHKRRAHEEKLIKCEVCDIKVKSNYDMRMHMQRKHSDERPYQCDECDKTFKTKDGLKSHKEIRHVAGANGQLACQLCPGLFFKSWKDNRNHMLDCHPDAMFSCEHCDHKAINKAALKSHNLNSHTKRIQCEFCEVQVATEALLKKHQQLKHSNIKPYQCDECGNSFRSKQYLQTHQNRHKGIKMEVKKVMCDICGKEFQGSNTIKKHLLSAHGIGVQDFQCDICDRKFISSNALKSHMEKDHTETPCDECSAMVKVYMLKQHKLLKHTAEHLKPYVCNICTPPRGFVFKGKYDDHNNVHTGAKPYSCDLCSYKCADRSNIIAHLKNTHKVLPKSKRKSETESYSYKP